MPVPSKTCCEAPLLYVDSSGYYNDPVLGPTLIVNTNATTPSFNEVINHCASFLNREFGQNPVEPEDCPCCPEGYTYKQGMKLCQGNNASDIIDPVPCIECVCQDPPPPPSCDDCVNQSLPIKFNLDDRTKRCVDCDIDMGPRGTNDKKLNNFIANFLVDPIVIFKLK